MWAFFPLQRMWEECGGTGLLEEGLQPQPKWGLQVICGFLWSILRESSLNGRELDYSDTGGGRGWWELVKIIQNWNSRGNFTFPGVGTEGTLSDNLVFLLIQLIKVYIKTPWGDFQNRLPRLHSWILFRVGPGHVFLKSSSGPQDVYSWLQANALKTVSQYGHRARLGFPNEEFPL